MPDRIASRRKGSGDGKPQESGDAGFQCKDGCSQAKAGGGAGRGKPVLAKGGKGCRADGRMRGEAEIVLQGEIHPEAGLHRRIEVIRTCRCRPADKVEKPLGTFGKAVGGGPGHGVTFHGFRFRHPHPRAFWPRAASRLSLGGKIAR